MLKYCDAIAVRTNNNCALQLQQKLVDQNIVKMVYIKDVNLYITQNH